MSSEKNEALWQAKLAAWVHDPAEKAFVLLRDPAGHTGGTVARLHQELFRDGLPADLRSIVEQADRWAAAADRPQFPRDADNSYRSWARVDFVARPVLIRPLSATEYDLTTMEEVDR